MAKLIPCGALVPHCVFVARGKDDTEVLIHLAHHLTAAHDLREIDHDLLKKARAAMHEVAASDAG